MRVRGNRTIKVVKKDLIEKIKQNKEIHIKEYEKAVIAYKVEALRQLKELESKLNSGLTNIKLNLTEPINNSANYDKIIEMFEWEVEEHVELEQAEFIEYIQDELDFSIQAKMSNTRYLH